MMSFNALLAMTLGNNYDMNNEAIVSVQASIKLLEKYTSSDKFNSN